MASDQGEGLGWEWLHGEIFIHGHLEPVLEAYE